MKKLEKIFLELTSKKMTKCNHFPPTPICDKFPLNFNFVFLHEEFLIQSDLFDFGLQTQLNDHQRLLNHNILAMIASIKSKEEENFFAFGGTKF